MNSFAASIQRDASVAALAWGRQASNVRALLARWLVVLAFSRWEVALRVP